MEMLAALIASGLSVAMVLETVAIQHIPRELMRNVMTPTAAIPISVPISVLSLPSIRTPAPA